MSGFAVGPPQFQSVRHEVGGVARGAENQVGLLVIDFQNPQGSQHGRMPQIVISSSHGFSPTSAAAARKRAYFDFRFGVDRDTQDRGINLGGVMSGSHMLEDFVGLRNFFLGSLFCTARSR